MHRKACICAAEGLVMQEKVPLQYSAVLHNVSTAAGDDASHNHAQDETPTLELDTGELLI